MKPSTRFRRFVYVLDHRLHSTMPTVKEEHQKTKHLGTKREDNIEFNLTLLLKFTATHALSGIMEKGELRLGYLGRSTLVQNFGPRNCFSFIS